MITRWLYIIINILSFILVLANITIVLIHYQTLPENIIIHYNISGNPDGYGNKITLLFLCLLNISIYSILTFLENKPHLYNYPIPITEINKSKLYLYGQRLIKFLKVIFIFAFTYISYCMLTGKSIGAFTVFLIIILPLFILVYFISKMRKIS